MHHSILGAGGVGGLIGAVLAHSGEQVTVIVRAESLARQPRELSLQSKFGTFTVPVEVAARVIEPDGILWITVKATQLDEALKNLGSFSGYVVPLLNGIDHVEMLRQRFGRERVIPATISVESERISPGVIVHRSPFVRLNVASSAREQLAPVMELFTRFGFECKFIDKESTLLWSKLAFLAPFAFSTSAARAPIGQVISDPTRKTLLEACIREACAVANAEGAGLNPEPLITAVNGMPAGMRSSMQKDLEAQRPPELDAIAGPILRGAREHGIAIPATQALVNEISSSLPE